jgi:tetratricopeptide (TPR) repeat protein
VGVAAHSSDYLLGLSAAQRQTLSRVNAPGLQALTRYLQSAQAVAFLGSEVAAPLYPPRDGLIDQLVDAAADRLTESQATTCRALADQTPEEVIEFLRQQLGTSIYRDVLREILRVRTDPESGRSWTETQELVCRCTFKGVVTTCYDPGILDARMRVRVSASATGYTSWMDDLGLDRWRTGEVFADAELPVLFAHGYHSRPESVVLATTEYRYAYEGKLSKVLGRLVDAEHLVWIGFSFADQRITAILHEVALGSGTRHDPGPAPRHVALVPWDPHATGNDPDVLARRAEIAYGAQIILYPVTGGDHTALRSILRDLASQGYPPVAGPPTMLAEDSRPDAPARETAPATAPAKWVPGIELADTFTGRAEEIGRLDRWAADPEVSLIGVTAWGGAGKTALVSEWVSRETWPMARKDIRGVFGWSFYADSAAEHWAESLLKWASQEFGVPIASDAPLAPAVLKLLRTTPLLLVLDGLEVTQEGPAGSGFGRLLDGILREILIGMCGVKQAGLLVLTSRFPFADLEGFQGSTVRMLEVPRFTLGEGSALLAVAGGTWLVEADRRAFVEAVEGHALAVRVIAGLLSGAVAYGDLWRLREDLATATRLDARVRKVLEFYASQLSEADRYMIAAVSLFTRPISPEAVLQVAQHSSFRELLMHWTVQRIAEAVQSRLAGLVSMHADGTISAHPLVRDTFRPLAWGAVSIAATVTLTSVPAFRRLDPDAALRVAETIEMLTDAGEFSAADGLYQSRSSDGLEWRTLPAARTGQRSALAFAARPRQQNCATMLSEERLRFYLNEAGLLAALSGDMLTAQEYLSTAVDAHGEVHDERHLVKSLLNQADCFGCLGDTQHAKHSAGRAIEYSESISRARDLLCTAKAYLAWASYLAGDSVAAERLFIGADSLESDNLYSIRGVRWAEFLARTGRSDIADVLTLRNRSVCARNGWNQDVALCDHLLGRLAMQRAENERAVECLEYALACFRKGEYLVDLAATLVSAAELARRAGHGESAVQYVTEAIAIAGPRGLIPTHAAALAASSRIYADLSRSDSRYLAKARDAADAAIRLATRIRALPWAEFDALNAHAYLDQVSGEDNGYSERVRSLWALLNPAELSSDPFAAVMKERRRRHGSGGAPYIYIPKIDDTQVIAPVRDD